MGLRDVDPTAWAVACEDIRQLASRYAVAMSHRDLDAVVALFVDDVRIGREASGRDALRADLAAQLSPLARAILHVTNHVIDVDDADHATGIVGTRAELELDGEWIVQLIEYDDTYERRDGRWCFVRRRHRLWYGAPLGTSPVGLAPAHWPASATGTGDLWDAPPERG